MTTPTGRLSLVQLRTPRILLVGVLMAAVVAAGAIASVDGASAAGASSPPVTTLTLQSQHPYTPSAPAGGTDDYHCTLVNPHVAKNSFIVSSQFFPNSVEVHHAILFLIPPDLAQAAVAADQGGKGWTCFGESALPGTVALNQISNTPWLSAWAPGHGKDVLPTGTGVKLPAGSMVVMQIHYNLLRGDKPVRAKLQLNTVPSTTPLKPLDLTLMPAPPDIPCPAGVTGALCTRSASLADLGQRFGGGAPVFDSVIESICGRNPLNPPAGNTTSCTWPIGGGKSIVRLGVHMHLLGRGMKIVLDPGTPKAQTLLNVTNYNFDYQRSYTLKTPVATGPGDTIGVTCTYDPTLRQELPQLRKLPPRFVTWGDGSSDEMCLALVQSVSSTGKASYSAA
jgi:Copper type II ascorbate-dependent monooxygenase, C-terminal domain